MGTLQEKIEQDLRTALKARQELELGALRLLKSDIQYELSKDGSKEISDEAVEAVIKRAVKRRRDSIDQFEKAGKKTEADQERSELAVIEKYLPSGPSEEEIRKAIEEVFARVNPAGPRDMGKVMGAVMGHFKGQNIDGNMVRQLVQEKLGS